MDGQEGFGSQAGRGEGAEGGAAGLQEPCLGGVEDGPARLAGRDGDEGVLVGGEGGAEDGFEPGVPACLHDQVDELRVGLARDDTQREAGEVGEGHRGAGGQRVGCGERCHEGVLPDRDEVQAGAVRQAAYEGRVQFAVAYGL